MSLLLVCSGGGHLKQLHQLAGRIPGGDRDRTWVTFDTGLSRGLLAGEDVRYATYAAPRDARNIARNAALAVRVLARQRWDAVISTGSSLAVDFLPLAAARGASAHFIETAARAAGPSLTGRILAPVPGVRTYTQYPAWASERWVYAGSIFDSFEPGPRRQRGDGRAVASAVVTVGTTESYGFERMLTPLVALLAGADVLWQTGVSDVRGLGIAGRESVPHPEVLAAVAAADVVVGHAGTGAALTALEAGRCPVLVPRLARHGEHVDDHQVQVADELHDRGLAIRCDAEDLTTEVLAEAAERSVARVAAPPPLHLDLDSSASGPSGRLLRR